MVDNPKIDLSIVFFHLERIGNLLMTANYHYNRILSTMPQSVEGENEEFDSKVALLDILSDFIIIQLDRFFEIFPLLTKIESLTYKKYELSRSLSELLSFMKSKEKIIRIWRNKLVAHSLQTAMNGYRVTDIDNNLNQTMRDIHLVSRLTVCYIIGFCRNIPDSTNSESDIDSMVGSIPSDHNFKEYWEEMKKTENEILKKVNTILEKNGFESIIGPDYSNFY